MIDFKLSPNFWYSEMVDSRIAEKLAIDNAPSDEHLVAAGVLSALVLQPLRDEVGPIDVSSWYRCAELNEAIGGAKESQHMSGEGADISTDRMTPEQLARVAINMHLPFDQIIVYPKRGIVHLSHCRLRAQRGERLINRDDGEGFVVWLES